MDATNLAIVLVVIALAGVLIFVFLQARRRKRLQRHFGPEYARVVREAGNRRRAERELERRMKRVESLRLHDLRPDERDEFIRRWKETQSLFVDDPSSAVEDADQLVTEVMVARGYPMTNFEQRAADVSVHYPDVVRNYRAARDIVQRNRNGEANTEDLRQAIVYQRSLFEDLIKTDDPIRTDHPIDQPVNRTRRQYDERTNQRPH